MPVCFERPITFNTVIAGKEGWESFPKPAGFGKNPAPPSCDQRVFASTSALRLHIGANSLARAQTLTRQSPGFLRALRCFKNSTTIFRSSKKMWIRYDLLRAACIHTHKTLSLPGRVQGTVRSMHIIQMQISIH